MSPPPEKRKASLAGLASLEMSNMATDNPEITGTLTQRQARRVVERFAMSMPLARCVAELAFAAAGGASS